MTPMFLLLAPRRIFGLHRRASPTRYRRDGSGLLYFLMLWAAIAGGLVWYALNG